MTKSSSKILSYVKSHKILTGFLCVALFIALGFAVQICMSDGTDQFTGMRKHVAEEELAEYLAVTRTDPFDKSLIYKIHVDDVRPMRDDLVRGWCDEDPNTSKYYIAVISQRTIFGIPIESGESRNECQYPITE